MDALKDITETTGLFYYTTMLDFERAEIRKNQKKYARLSSDQKQLIHQYILNESPILFAKLQQKIASLKLNINNYQELYTFFSEYDLCECFQGKPKLNAYFPCVFISGNRAWISKSRSGHYRYFTRNSERTYGLDFVELLEVYYGVSPSQAIERGIRDFRIHFMEDVWMQEQNKKYLSNLTIIHNAKKYIQKDYEVLHFYIAKHLKVLETINVLGNINVKKKEFSFKNQNIFFASNSYIANFLGNYSSSSCNKILNLFAVLGLIEKVKEENIPPQLLHESRSFAEKRNLGNIVSYYIVPPMVDLLEKANERAILLKKHNIRSSNITKEKIAFILGDDVNNIYVQTIQKNKNSNESYVFKELEKNFVFVIQERGYATKDDVAKKRIGKMTRKEKTRCLEKIWKTLVFQYELQYIKPTKAMKKKLGLKTDEYITIKVNGQKEV